MDEHPLSLVDLFIHDSIYEDTSGYFSFALIVQEIL